MSNVPEFKPWPKIQRPKNMNITITEKIDGTNGCVIVEQGEVTGVQSRKRMIVVKNPETSLLECPSDNMGFGHWVIHNQSLFEELGDGYHYGEWAGPGIQRNKHNLDTKRFFLFNTFRPVDTLPEGLYQVPVLYEGPFSQEVIDEAYTKLWRDAEEAGYTPEGVMVYHHLFRTYVKHTYANQDGKWTKEYAFQKAGTIDD